MRQWVVSGFVVLAVVLGCVGSSWAGDSTGEGVDILLINLNLTEGPAPAVDRLAGELRRLSKGARVDVVHFSKVTASSVGAMSPRAVVLSPQGEPWPMYAPEDLARMGALVRGLDVPVLGVCGGHQFLAMAYGAKVAPIVGELAPGATSYDGMFREKGATVVTIVKGDPLLAGASVGERVAVHEYHAEEVKALPDGFVLLIEGEVSRFQGMRHATKPVYGVQFHPESKRRPHPFSERLLSNFIGLALK